MPIYDGNPHRIDMGNICPIIKDRCMGKDCKFWRPDAKYDKKADTFYELGTGECLFLRIATNTEK